MDWADGGRAVLVRKQPADHSKNGEAWLVPIDGSPARKVADYIPNTIPMVFPVRSSPDGRRFTIPVSDFTRPPTEIISLENFLPPSPAPAK
jgi:hypothetical protein